MMATVGLSSQSRSWYDMAVAEEFDRVENLSPCERSRIFGHPVTTSTPIRRDDQRARSRIPARRRLADGYEGQTRREPTERGDRRSRQRDVNPHRRVLQFSASAASDAAIFDKERSPLREDAKLYNGSMTEASESWAQVVAKMSGRVKTTEGESEESPRDETSSTSTGTRVQPLAERNRPQTPTNDLRKELQSTDSVGSDSPDQAKRKRRFETNFNDPHRLAQRQKQIDYGKNTIGYDRYIQAVPRNQRKPGQPRTPNKYLNCPKRTFDIMLKHWRRALHEWDPPTSQGDLSPTSSEDVDRSVDSAVNLSSDLDISAMETDPVPESSTASVGAEDSCFYSEFDLSACSMDLDFLVSSKQ